jgi:hypothetical protein
MDFGKEFEKYAVKHRGISSNTIHGLSSTALLILRLI